jgi:hypothetical protein
VRHGARGRGVPGRDRSRAGSSVAVVIKGAAPDRREGLDVQGRPFLAAGPAARPP